MINLLKNNLFKEIDFDLSNKVTLNTEENKDYFKLLVDRQRVTAKVYHTMMQLQEM